MPKKSTTTKTFQDVLAAIKNKNLKVKTAVGGINVEIDPLLKAEMFAPNSDEYKDLNNYSAVLKISYGSTSFLLTGDAEEISEREMLAKGYNLKADVLKIGHHGSNSSTIGEFLKIVSPRSAIISVGKGNDYGHPHKETLDKLYKNDIQVYRTDEAGTVIATSDGQEVKFDKNISPIKPQGSTVESSVTPQSENKELAVSSSLKNESVNAEAIQQSFSQLDKKEFTNLLNK